MLFRSRKELLTGTSREVLFYLKGGEGMAKVDKERQELAKTILEANGVTYEDWLNEQHLKVITSNMKVLKEGLEARKNM